MAEGPTRDEIRRHLFNAGVKAADYGGGEEKYQAALLEQYKLYVEMADRISSRRGLTNTFFLTLNTLVFTVVGVVWTDAAPDPSTITLVVLLLATLSEVVAWWSIMRSYRQLNSAKYKVVGLIEENLPASPYWAEWKGLKEGKDRSVYWPLSHVEQIVPAVFAVIYILGFALAFFTA